MNKMDLASEDEAKTTEEASQCFFYKVLPVADATQHTLFLAIPAVTVSSSGNTD